jgi:hypothetical protein
MSVGVIEVVIEGEPIAERVRASWVTFAEIAAELLLDDADVRSEPFAAQEEAA